MNWRKQLQITTHCVIYLQCPHFFNEENNKDDYEIAWILKNQLEINISIFFFKEKIKG